VVERTLERYGRIDVLVNNAGLGLSSPLWKVRLEDAERVFALNFFAPLEMMRLAVPHMRDRGGVIVNIGSMAGRVPLPWLTVYCASKYALGALTDCARMELARFGIHSITVCPGYVRTGFQRNALGETASATASEGVFTIDAEQCANAIIRGVERGASTVVTPWTGWLFIALERLLPGLVHARLAAINERLWTSG
jgi:short-subunit dehydrogenase